MGFQRQADLDDTEAQQDQANGTNQAEDEVAQVIYNGDRVVCCKGRGAEGKQQGEGQNRSGIGAKTFFDASRPRQAAT